MIIRKTVIVLFIFVFFSTVSEFRIKAEDGWEFQRDQDGIEVYTRDIPGTNYKEFRGTMYVKNARLTSLVAAFDDTPSYIKWMHNCIEAKLLTLCNARERYTYTVTHAPWPATDRDLIVYSLLSQNRKNLTVTIAISGKSDYIKPMKNRVRIPFMNALWTFTPMQDGEVMVTYQTVNDPGGWLPLRLLNLSMVDLPFNTMKKFRDIVKEDKYLTAKIAVITEPKVF
jgi:hypothetical protein